MNIHEQIAIDRKIPMEHIPFVGPHPPRPGCFDATKVPVVRTLSNAIPPSISQPGDVAADLFTPEEIKIPPRGTVAVDTGIAIELPAGFRGRLQSRSGLALNKNVEVGAGLIDCSFRNPIGVVLRNHSDQEVIIEAGKAIANLCVERYTYPLFEEVDSVQKTARSAGWGSSGR